MVMVFHFSSYRFFTVCGFFSNSMVHGNHLQLRRTEIVGYIFNGTTLFKTVGFSLKNSLFMMYIVCLQFKSINTQGFYVMAIPH